MESKLTLRSSDGQEFLVEEKAALMSKTIKNMVEDVSVAGTVIPLANLDGKTLALVIEYCKKHVEEDPVKEDLKKFDDEFLKGMEFRDLFDLIKAANYLDVQKLLDLVAQRLADRIKDKQPEEVQDIFSIQNDHTPEEEAKLRRENAWAFD